MLAILTESYNKAEAFYISMKEENDAMLCRFTDYSEAEEEGK